MILLSSHDMDEARRYNLAGRPACSCGADPEERAAAVASGLDWVDDVVVTGGVLRSASTTFSAERIWVRAAWGRPQRRACLRC